MEVRPKLIPTFFVLNLLKNQNKKKFSIYRYSLYFDDERLSPSLFKFLDAPLDRATLIFTIKPLINDFIRCIKLFTL